MMIVCANCFVHVNKPSGAVGRAQRIGAPLYCDKECAGLARRCNKTAAQRREEKRLYDIEYRAANFERIKASKRDRHKRIYTYETGKAMRDLRKARGYDHSEYCRGPDQVAKRKKRDRRRYAAEFGPFAECHTLLMDLLNEINGRITDYETRIQNGTLNKRLTRRRRDEAASGGGKDSHGIFPQSSTVGHPQRRKERRHAAVAG
jgi:hypothetical protein